MKLILQVVDWPCSIGVFKEGGNEGNLQESEVGQMQTSTQIRHPASSGISARFLLLALAVVGAILSPTKHHAVS